MGSVNGTYKILTGAKKGTLGPMLSLSLSIYIYFRAILTVVDLEFYYEGGAAGFYVM
jgi:hypothetical protein